MLNELVAVLESLAELLLEKVDGELVGGHHDRRVGNLPHKLGAKAAIEPNPSLLLVNEAQGLPERSVLSTRLSHSCARNLCKRRKIKL